MVSSADARPTVQSYAVFDKLAGQAAEQLDALRSLVDGPLADLNRDLAALGIPLVGA